MNGKREIGVCYYPEHWPEERWPIDARMMREAGISKVRIGEFAWSRLEPEPGKYDFEWLERAIAILHSEGLEVVLGTPTATPPKWLVDRMPDMLPIDVNGKPRGFGSRRHYCFSHEGYRKECVRIVTELARVFGRNPGVTAWQTDNEYGCHDTTLSYSAAARDGFREWLAQKYQSPQALNRAWGTVFWSSEYQSFDEVELPDMAVTETNPAHRLDFRRFSSDKVVSFNRLQTDIIRKYSPDRDILHNFMGSFTQFDHFTLSEDLDAASWDSYPLGFLDRDISDPERKARYMRVGDPDLQAFHHDLYRACGRGRFWVMEQQPGPVNWAPHNPAPAPGAIRLWVWEAFAANAEVVSFFRWRQPPFGQEQMHEALLRPDGSTNEAYEVARAVSAETKGLLPPPANQASPAALVFDYESDWAWSIQPQGASFRYLELVLTFYRAMRSIGLTVDIVPPRAATIGERKLIVVPGMYSVSEELCAALDSSGAVVLAGPRSGSRNPDFQIPEGLPPGEALQKRIAVRVLRSESFPPPTMIPVGNGSSGPGFVTWREFAEAGEGSVAVQHTVDGEPALIQGTERRWHYLTGYPNGDLARELLLRLVEAAGVASQPLHRDIRIRNSGPYRFVFNHGPEPVDISDLAAAGTLRLGQSPLEPRGVAIIELPD
jgi:beta-galactosidase